MCGIENKPSTNCFFLVSRCGPTLTTRTGGAVTLERKVVDVECAAISRRQQRAVVLSVRLNEYAEELDRLGKDEAKVDACGRFQLTALAATRDAAGRTLFNYALSRARSAIERQRACTASHVTLQPTCTGRQ